MLGVKNRFFTFWRLKLTAFLLFSKVCLIMLHPLISHLNCCEKKKNGTKQENDEFLANFHKGTRENFSFTFQLSGWLLVLKSVTAKDTTCSFKSHTHVLCAGTHYTFVFKLCSYCIRAAAKCKQLFGRICLIDACTNSPFMPQNGLFALCSLYRNVP